MRYGIGFEGVNSKNGIVMKINKGLTKNLARTADLLNTINGGTVYPTFNTSKESDHLRIEVSMPSVEPDDLKVEVNNDNLMIFQYMMVNNLPLPNLLGLFKLSRNAVVEDISAEYHHDILTVIVPFSELNDGLNRSIEIHKD